MVSDAALPKSAVGECSKQHTMKHRMSCEAQLAIHAHFYQQGIFTCKVGQNDLVFGV